MYNIYDNKTKECIKSNCTFIAIIPAGERLIDDEIKKYYGIDESNIFFEGLHRPSRIKRYVFDKCVIPDNPRFLIERCEDK